MGRNHILFEGWIVDYFSNPSKLLLLPRFLGIQSVQRAKTNYNPLHAVRYVSMMSDMAKCLTSKYNFGTDTRLLQYKKICSSCCVSKILSSFHWLPSGSKLAG